jgi:hypothetical protein
MGGMNGFGRAFKGSSAALALAAAAVTIGCGASGDGGSAEAGSPQQAREEFQEARLDFSRCMRENGIDMPDPQPGGGMVLGGPGNDVDPGTANFREAEEECRKHMEGVEPPELDAEQQQEFQDAALAFARCMRGEGIDMPDPQIDGGRVRMRVGPGEGMDRDDPAQQAAFEKCSDELPRGPDGPGAGVPAPAP